MKTCISGIQLGDVAIYSSFFTRKLVLAFGFDFCCSDTCEYKFGDLQSKMAKYEYIFGIFLKMSVNRPTGPYSVRELVHLLHYYYIVLQVACPYRKLFQ